jgi:hypothetical protein
MSESSKFWETERIVIAPETPEEWGPVWSAIGAEFRSRSGNREGSIYTNHQGLVAIRSISLMIKEQSTALPELHEHDFRDLDGMTLPNRLAFLVANQLMVEARCWSGQAKEGLAKLSDVVGTAVADAFIKNRNGVAVIDITSPSAYGYSPSLRHKMGIVFHEGTHVWQYTLNEQNLGLIREEKMLEDPEYPVLARMLGNYYENMTPADIYSEATAWGIAGEGWNVGLYTKARTEAFLERFFRAVKLDYGREALDMLHLVHPHVRRVLDHVRFERDVGRGEERTSGYAVEGGGGGIADSGRTGEEIPGASRRDEASPGSLGEGRDDGPDEVKMRLGISVTNGDRALALTSALKTIAAIDPSNQADTRSWRELAAVAVGTARAAVAGFERVEEGKVNQALMEIAKMDPAGGPDARRSCKEVTVTAVGLARTALDEISQGTNVGTDVAMGAAETALDAPSNGRPPAQGISW